MSSTSHAIDQLTKLAAARSKHSHYQLLHPSLHRLIPAIPQPAGKYELERAKYMKSRLPFSGFSVRDIGANTGYFSFAAVEGGATRVVAEEGNREHAAFLSLAAEAMGLQPKLEVRPNYCTFTLQTAEKFDVTLCLNVLHHLGDDFGTQHSDMVEAKRQMMEALNAMSTVTTHLWFQLGFNWKGDRNRPLFERGLKSEIIQFVSEGTKGHWTVDDVAIYDPETAEYRPATDRTLVRYDHLGEFLNRPLFKLTSTCC